MNKPIKLSFVAALCAVFSSPLGAQMRYTIVTEIVREDNKVNRETVVEDVIVDGEKGRIDFLAPDGSRPKPKNASFIVTNNAGETFIWSQGGDAVCADWSTEEFFETVGTLMKKGKRFINADLFDAKVEKTHEEPGPEMFGYATTHIRSVASYGLKGRFLFKKFEYKAEESDESWMTTDFELPAMERRWAKAFGETGFRYADDIQAKWDAILTGPVLKRKNVLRLTNLRSNEVSTRTEIMEVTKLEMLESSQIPAGTFNMPKCKPVAEDEREDVAKRFIKKSLK